MDFGRAIRLARTARKLSQKDLATLSEVDPSYISLLESNRRKPSMATLELFAEKLDIPLYLLFLLGSDREDLRGIDEGSAAILSAKLLNVVVQGQSS